ncbi:MAG: segregation and condensation protein [Frankiaceae bacterium]|nr:segregation and condensation protein [Frankiaceae bacterium]
MASRDPSAGDEIRLPDVEDHSAESFHVHLAQFEGPFDLLLSLIAKRQLDVTLIALAQVTDEFIAHIRSRGEDWDLDQASAFLVVAATLLDLKVARLLPSGEVDDEDDLALLEARDLLFARLLQYRAYKELAAIMADRFAREGRRFPRAVPMEPTFLALLPEVLLGVGAEQFAAVAVRAMAPRPEPVVSIDHLHAPKVSVREQAVLLAARLRAAGQGTFRGLTADAGAVLVVVARFLALLELYREGAVTFEQMSPLGELHVRWVPSDVANAELERWAHETGEIDDYDAPAPQEQP